MKKLTMKLGSAGLLLFLVISMSSCVTCRECPSCRPFCVSLSSDNRISDNYNSAEVISEIENTTESVESLTEETNLNDPKHSDHATY